MWRRSFFLLAVSIIPGGNLVAQVTHGQKPKLPAPFETKSAGNGPDREKPPEGFLPTVPAGFRVNEYARSFKRPRWLTVAPNGDIFLADTGAGEIIVLRDARDTGAAQVREVFVSRMRRPFGIAFHEDYAYVGNMNELVRFRYDPKTSKRLGEEEHLMYLPSGGHDTRSLAFSPDGRTLATASFDGTMKLWNFATRREVASLKIGNLLTLTFSPDGQNLAVCYEDGSLRLWPGPVLDQKQKRPRDD